MSAARLKANRLLRREQGTPERRQKSDASAGNACLLIPIVLLSVSSVLVLLLLHLAFTDPYWGFDLGDTDMLALAHTAHFPFFTSICLIRSNALQADS